jgi:hypothetical protein
MVSEFKDKFAKAKKIGGGIFTLILIMGFAYVIIDYGYDYFENEDADTNKPYVPKPKIFTGTYEDLLRHESEHVGKIVAIEGYVSSVDKSNDIYAIWITNTLESLYATEFSAIVYHERLLSGDKIIGYGTYAGICTENRIGDPFTCYKDARLLNYDFEVMYDGTCSNYIATKLSLCG